MQMLIMGPPGAGKGTQAAEIVKRCGIPQISTGEMFRSAVVEGTELGKKAKSSMESGGLVPDEVTIGIVRERLKKSDCEDGFLLDGFPRTVEQAKALEKILQEQGKEITLVINIVVPAEELVERAVGRRICRKCGATYHVKNKPARVAGKCDECGGELYQRADDSAETMAARLETYEKNTRPLVEYYKARGKYFEVDGNRGIGEVTAEILKKLSAGGSDV